MTSKKQSWRTLLDSDEGDKYEQIAKEEGVTKAELCRIFMWLGFEVYRDPEAKLKGRLK